MAVRSSRQRSLLLARALAVTSVIVYVPLGTALWVALFESGVHPTLSGVLLGLMAPAVPVGRDASARGRFGRSWTKRMKNWGG